MTTTEDLDVALARLVPDAVAGDAAVMQRIINLIHAPVVRYCRARVPQWRYPTAEDIAQEVCLAVARALPGYADRGLPFMAFVYRIAANKIVDALRSQSRDQAVPTEDVPDTEVTENTPESSAIVRDACNEIAGLLDILSDKARDIIILRVFEGYSAEETARILGTSAGAVRVAQFRALAKLREHLAAQDAPGGAAPGDHGHRAGDRREARP
ncbi:RNA polymerase sigma factor ShbA [Corynebacterium bovis]|uniref:RNA polymerase sigma factor ShbA n=1 Tax=Corynebacterium bovis TaxID=36808 RepID=UPI0024468F2D|nr:RNA polymerase sigma factor ShbA [Corynebacterium bovis]MDH2455615.1 RNA polymerase sigma factor ShbA [Corynebacterium bovis]